MFVEHAAAGALRKPFGDGAADEMPQRRNGVRHVTLCSVDVREGRNPGVRQALLVRRSFFGGYRG